MLLLEMKQEVPISDFEHFEHDSFLTETGKAAKTSLKICTSRIKTFQLTMSNIFIQNKILECFQIPEIHYRKPIPLKIRSQLLSITLKSSENYMKITLLFERVRQMILDSTWAIQIHTVSRLRLRACTISQYHNKSFDSYQEVGLCIMCWLINADLNNFRSFVVVVLIILKPGILYKLSVSRRISSLASISFNSLSTRFHLFVCLFVCSPLHYQSCLPSHGLSPWRGRPQNPMNQTALLETLLLTGQR
jgi:hypothetical protein